MDGWQLIDTYLQFKLLKGLRRYILLALTGVSLFNQINLQLKVKYDWCSETQLYLQIFCILTNQDDKSSEFVSIGAVSKLAC